MEALFSFPLSRSQKVWSEGLHVVRGLVSLEGVATNLFSHNLTALIIGPVLLGISHGFINHFMPLYISEMTPENHRDMLNMKITQMSTISIFTTNTINYFTSKNKSDDGWRISLGLAVVLALIITIGSLFLFDTSNSLIDHERNDEARDVLRRIRNTLDIDEEHNDLVFASTCSNSVKNS
ncbi:Sugar transport protein 1 [Acorus gramineus]|uniref:Sugar transport protein 1 n=1 Tax=Acorus gramineus TaxID=55184 RepID=A0AAV9B846_ACOGR|nr:Sugar transport protein 1 [Acorus gramineus]